MTSDVTTVRVEIVGAPVACVTDVKDTWRELSEYVADQLMHRFDDAVQVDYYDLFDPACPPLPPDAELPLVLVNGEVLSNGGKLSMPLIRRAVERLLPHEPHPGEHSSAVVLQPNGREFPEAAPMRRRHRTA